MHGHDEGAQFFLIQILNFINKNRDCAVTIFSSLTHCNEKLRQIDFKIATIGRPLFRINSQPKSNITYGNVENTNKTSKHSKSTFYFIADASRPIQVKQKFPKTGNEQ